MRKKSFFSRLMADFKIRAKVPLGKDENLLITANIVPVIAEKLPEP